MQSEAAVMDWRQRVLFFTGTLSVMFALAMLTGFTMQWRWWGREIAALVITCACVAFMRNRLVMVAAIGLVIVSRLLIGLVFHLLSMQGAPH